MVLQKLALSRIGQSMRDDNDKTSFFVYSTTDAPATVLASGYFNDARAALKVGDCIWVSAAVGAGGAETFIVRVATMPDGANVTVVADLRKAA